MQNQIHSRWSWKALWNWRTKAICLLSVFYLLHYNFLFARFSMHFVDSKRQPLFHPPRNLLLFYVHYIHFYLQQLPFTIVSRLHPCCSLTSDGEPWWQTHHHHSSQLGFAEKMIVHHKFCQQKKEQEPRDTQTGGNPWEKSIIQNPLLDLE